MRINKILTIVITILAVIFCAYIAHAAGTIDHEYWPDNKLRLTKAFDDLGDLREESFYREDGSLEQHMKYDSNGHEIEVSYYGGNGKLREGADGWAAVRKLYKDGQMRVEAYYNSDGKVQERKEYNSSGDLVGKQYVGDKDILPAEEYNPIPPITGYETTSYYDSYGRPEGTTTIDRNPTWWGWPYWPDEYY